MRQSAQESHPRRDPEPLRLASKSAFFFAAAHEMQRKVGVARREPRERVDRDIEPLLTLETTGGEEMAAGWPSRCATRYLDRIRDHAHTRGIQRRDCCGH